MPRAEQSTIDFINEYFDVMKAKDYDRLGEYFADHITLTFANAPIVTGKEVVRGRCRV